MKSGIAPEVADLGPDWLIRGSRDVLVNAGTSLAFAATSESQRRILWTALANSRCAKAPHCYQAAVHLPLLVHAAIAGRHTPADSLAVVTTLMWAGAELHDNLVDGDLPGSLATFTPGEITYASMALGCVLPASLLVKLDAPIAIREAMQQQFATGLMRMFAGQSTDLALTDAREFDPNTIEESIAGKNGAAQSLYAALASRLAGASDDLVAKYAEFGLALGIASQLRSDFFEMFFAEKSRDLLHGTRTLHIALAQTRMDPLEQQAFLELLDQAKTDGDAIEKVRALLRRPRFLKPWIAKVNDYVARAERALSDATPLGPAEGILRNLVRSKRAHSC